MGSKSFEKRLASVAGIHYGAARRSILRVARPRYSTSLLFPCTFRHRTPARTEAVSLRAAFRHFEVDLEHRLNAFMAVRAKAVYDGSSTMRSGIGRPQTDRDLAGT